MSWLLEYARPGVVLPARVTHLEHFGAFVDLGCGFTSLVPMERISAARISHPADRFAVGQDILVTVTAVDAPACRIYLSHKELLGTWLENAAGFAPGDTVTGIVRSIQDYGVFIELTPQPFWPRRVEAGAGPGGQRIRLHQVYPAGKPKNQAPGDPQAGPGQGPFPPALFHHRRYYRELGLLTTDQSGFPLIFSQ